MSITIRIPTPMRQFTQQQAVLTGTGDTVGEVLEDFKARFPEVAARFFSGSSKASRFVNLYLNDEDIRFLQDLGTPVADGDSISIVLAIAGGCAWRESL